MARQTSPDAVNRTVQVRRCQNGDFAGVLSLLHQLWPGKALDRAALRVVYQRALASDSQVYLCATVDDRVIAFGSLTLKNNLWPDGPVGNVDELVVDGVHRGSGIGTRLLKELAAVARRSNCRRMELDSALHRQSAHEFYERFGFQKRAFLFSKAL